MKIVTKRKKIVPAVALLKLNKDNNKYTPFGIIHIQKPDFFNFHIFEAPIMVTISIPIIIKQTAMIIPTAAPPCIGKPPGTMLINQPEAKTPSKQIRMNIELKM